MAPRKEDDRKSYSQLCTVARALDVIGDRWTLLIVRELLGGPARFNELQAGLPSIAKNLLTDRLRRLEADGLVQRATGQRSLYTLTDLGIAARPVVEALGMWGAKAPKLRPPEHDRSIRSVAVALHTFLTRAGQAMPDERLVVELAVDGQPLEIVLGPRPSVSARSSSDPDARVAVTQADLTNYLHGTAFDKKAFTLRGGDKAARAALLQAMAVFF